MSYDLNVLVIQQEIPMSIPFESSIQVINESEQSLRYFDAWKYMKHTKGSWYCLGHGEEELFNALSLLKAQFNSKRKSLFIPNWLENEEVRSNLVPLSVRAEYIDDFIKLIKYMISLSPVNTIMFMARFQSYDEEVVYGVLTFKQFWSLHQKGQLMFNVCYLIKE